MDAKNKNENKNKKATHQEYSFLANIFDDSCYNCFELCDYVLCYV